RVTRADAAGILAQVAQPILPREELAHPLPEVSPREVLHGEEQVIIRNADVVDARDVRVIEMRDEVVLAQESVEGVPAFNDIGNLPEDLEHPLLAGLRQLRQVNTPGPDDPAPSQAVVGAHA